jgi:phenolic acid decarboxylase
MNLYKLSLMLMIVLFLTSCEDNKYEDLPEKLVGLNIQYKYDNDREYKVKLEKEGLSYRYVSGSKPEKWWGPFPYHHAVFDEEYQVLAWHEVGYDDYITLMIDLEDQKLFGSGIIAGKEVHFQPAKIKSLSFE